VTVHIVGAVSHPAAAFGEKIPYFVIALSSFTWIIMGSFG